MTCAPPSVSHLSSSILMFHSPSCSSSPPVLLSSSFSPSWGIVRICFSNTMKFTVCLMYWTRWFGCFMSQCSSYRCSTGPLYTMSVGRCIGVTRIYTVKLIGCTAVFWADYSVMILQSNRKLIIIEELMNNLKKTFYYWLIHLQQRVFIMHFNWPIYWLQLMKKRYVSVTL